MANIPAQHIYIYMRIWYIEEKEAEVVVLISC